MTKEKLQQKLNEYQKQQKKLESDYQSVVRQQKKIESDHNAVTGAIQAVEQLIAEIDTESQEEQNGDKQDRS